MTGLFQFRDEYLCSRSTLLFCLIALTIARRRIGPGQLEAVDRGRAGRSERPHLQSSLSKLAPRDYGPPRRNLVHVGSEHPAEVADLNLSAKKPAPPKPESIWNKLSGHR